MAGGKYFFSAKTNCMAINESHVEVLHDYVQICTKHFSFPGAQENIREMLEKYEALKKMDYTYLLNEYVYTHIDTMIKQREGKLAIIKAMGAHVDELQSLQFECLTLRNMRANLFKELTL